MAFASLWVPFIPRLESLGFSGNDINKNLSLKEFFNYFSSKYGPENYNLYHILKSLVYFEDAEKDPDLHMLVEFSWENIKSFFMREVKNFGIRD